ncbi:YceD family protein [Phorcysia thermohydrogeniphila]|uniref:Large ribosomal RNA subunit accumulation protein YceD n=1 Tax=Phorcysia thermohydrogeniphila TaxID=936138 RepID=A0A4R1GPI6_9BACT|nr:DUF177 domain-containing protein [Phorcysia thermohydrogeniphila]TCK06382.1 uncharacterized protein CLV27_0183 [Phorcysia thermohydrogeniphila]
MKRRINLNEVTAREPIRVETEIQPKLLELPKEEVSSATSFKLRVEVYKRPVGYGVKGRIEGEVELTCSRCNKKFMERIDRDFAFRLMPTSEITGGEIKSSDLDIKFSDEEVLDLVEVVREQILLNLPVKPLCDEECEVPVYREWEDKKGEQWEKLKALKNKLEKEK